IGREGWRTLSVEGIGRLVEGLAERGGGERVGASGGIGRGGWRTLSGGQWRDWQRVIGRGGWRTRSRSQWTDWQRGMEDTEWEPVEGLAERGDGGH
ncbi:unnamed protein product, partial [Staurois parvus]